ncbi:MAG: SGNH/GDSL hydrolase family protein [Chloroflexota bacterium]
MLRRKQSLQLIVFVSLVTLLTACTAAAPTATPTPVGEPTTSLTPTLPDPTITPVSEPTPTTADSTNTPRPTRPAATPTSRATATAVSWQDMPVIPVVSDRAREIFQHGIELGRNPNAFAKVGDCGGTPSWFLGVFDGPPDNYRLGEYEYLRETIEHFAGSFARESVTTRPGFSIASVFAPLWADPAQCKSGEGPLICEYRITNAGFAIIMMGTNDHWHQDIFEKEMRRAIEDSIERGVLPILSTKADNVEQDGSINATIVRLAQEYDIPLWNFWAAVQPLPNHGLQDDGVHLTWVGNRFDDPEAVQRGWPVRNLTALQVLDAVWRGVTEEK